MVKQADSGFIAKFKNIMDIWIHFRIQQIWVHILEIIILFFSALVRCHLENLCISKSHILKGCAQVAMGSDEGTGVEGRI